MQALADISQATRLEGLSPAMQSYLRERVSEAGADAPWLLPTQWQMRLYQCLGDAGSARALCRDLLDLADTAASDDAGLVAVFECAPCQDRRSFEASLATHLRLMQQFDTRLSLTHLRGHIDEAWLQIMSRSVRMIALHADAERLSRVLPCPVLAFSML
ncbi:hypothetical protein [Paucibacter sp. XJ19-41]|uniref:hypothetical protein n=1 Tax=Paucibacter sp. XJ19-41 TaxID=2927824 RepID=UPI00234A3EBF|nr:hypothetical protein [Paucibacter sp. XJ19-41]MDC6169258.1 hypothetical protein [Paucibacter sp. XJ19-41]